MNNYRIAALAAGVVITVAAGYGVAGRLRSGSEPIRIEPIQTVTALAGYPLPLDRFMPSAAEQLTLDRAHSILVTQCMRDLGFTSYRAATPVQPALVEGPGEFGFLDLTRAAADGFHNATPKATPAATAPSADSPAEIIALSGTVPGAAPASAAPTTRPTSPSGRPIPAGGCTAAAAAQLAAGDPRVRNPLVAQLVQRALRSTEQDPRVKAGIRAWTDCMYAAGFTYEAPIDVVSEQWADKPTPTEKAIAVADVDCTLRTNLPGIGMAVLSAEEKQLIRSHAGALDDERAGIDAELERAHRIIEGASP